MIQECYTVEQASQHALEWCKNHPGWKRICDIENVDALYYTFQELSDKVRKKWIDWWHDEYVAEGAWNESSESKCKVPYGFISGTGKFYKKVTDIPPYHNMMMVYKIG